MLTLTSTLPLSGGHAIPLLGFGTWKLADGPEARLAIHAALETGYRHIDTAAAYENEASVGSAINESGIPREEIFLTTKCWNDDIRGGADGVNAAFHRSLKALQTPYVDLYLLHWPIAEADLVAWHELEKLQAAGLIREIGVSNYLPPQLKSLIASASIVPAVNQIEFHPWLQQPNVTAENEANNIVTEAWSPLMQGQLGDVPEIAEIADAHGKSPAQIVLRWNLQRGIVTIPKSTNPKHIAENANVFGFELSPAEINTINHLNRNQRLGPDPGNVDF